MEIKMDNEKCKSFWKRKRTLGEWCWMVLRICVALVSLSIPFVAPGIILLALLTICGVKEAKTILAKLSNLVFDGRFAIPDHYEVLK